MPILHCLPPVDGRDNRLLALYHEGLRRHWGWPDRAVGAGLAAIGIGMGWSAAERRLLPAATRTSGLSMADRRGVHRLLNPAGYPLARNLLRNKALFARHVARHRLAAAATFDPEAADLECWLGGQEAVIAKPGFSSKGKAIAAFRRDGDQWIGRGGKSDTRALALLLRRYLARHGVVQELLSAHDRLRGLSPGALPTLRVVICADESGRPESCVTVLRLGSGGDRPVDNFNAGGLAVRLDPSGRCEAAFRASENAAQAIATHPVTNRPIRGQHVPDLAAAIELAEQAHRTLPDGYAVVGWDIGLTDRGPMLVEGNWNPGTDIIQLVDGVGLDRTRLGELYRFHLERVPGELWRATRPIEW